MDTVGHDALAAPRLVWLWWVVPAALFAFLTLAEAPILFAVVGGGSIAFLILATKASLRERLRQRGRTVLQVALATVVLIGLPSFARAVNHILAPS